MLNSVFVDDLGIFDLPAALLTKIDFFLFGSWPLISKPLVWGGICSVASMLIYLLVSNQQKLLFLKKQSSLLRRKLIFFDGDLEEIWPLTLNLFKLSFNHLFLTFWPVLLASLPVLIVLVWFSNTYSLKPIELDEPILVKIESADENLEWSSRAKRVTANEWQIFWPASEKRVIAKLYNKKVFTLHENSRSSILHKKKWWNNFIGNPAGYLPPDTKIEKVIPSWRKNEFLKFGPTWMRGWPFLFFVTLICVSLGVKVIFKIE